MNKRGSRARRRAVRVVMTALIATALAIMGLPAMGASADTGETQGTAVLKIGSQISVTSSANPVSPSGTVQLTATFAVIAGNSDVSPTGEVTFVDGATALGTATLNGQSASWSGQLPVGTHSVTATYPGDTYYTSGASQPFVLTVAYVPTLAISVTGGVTTLPGDGSWSPDIYVAATSDPAAADLPHTRFALDLSGIAGLAANQLGLQEDNGGTWQDVQLTDQAPGDVVAGIGADSDLGPGSSTGVTLRMKALRGAQTGTLTMAASLLSSPDGQDWQNVVATATQNFTVQPNNVPTPTTTTVSANSVVTSAGSAPVALAATVVPAAATGIVTFMSDGVAVGAATLSGGTATTSARLPLGYHTISASYAGDGAYATSMGTQQAQITVMPPGGNLHAITPVRLLDTRNGTGAPRAKVAPGASVDLQVTGAGGIPATGVAAISVNVTVVQPTGSGYVTVYPADARTAPATSNIDFPSIVNTAGLVMTPVSAAGKIRILNKSNGFVSLIADVSAWFGQQTNSLDQAGRYNAVAPYRLVDTRKTAIMKPGATLAVQAAGLGGLPATGVGAVVLNVTTVNPTAAAWLALYPSGGVLPHVSTNAFQKGETRAGRVIVGVGNDGKVNVYNSPYASTNVVVDVCGWFTKSTSPVGGSTFVPLTASTRMTALQTGGASWGSLESRPVPISGVAGIPKMTDAIPPQAVVANLHIASPTLGGYLAAYPADPRPTGSDLNFVVGQTVQNLGIAKLNAQGAFNLFHTSGTAKITIDLYGYFA